MAEPPAIRASDVLYSGNVEWTFLYDLPIMSHVTLKEPTSYMDELKEMLAFLLEVALSLTEMIMTCDSKSYNCTPDICARSAMYSKM